jgi:hypothetical protein
MNRAGASLDPNGGSGTMTPLSIASGSRATLKAKAYDVAGSPMASPCLRPRARPARGPDGQKRPPGHRRAVSLRRVAR